MEKLINHGANINQISKNGICPLNMAIKDNSISAIKYLLSKGAKIYFKDKNQEEHSPLL